MNQTTTVEPGAAQGNKVAQMKQPSDKAVTDAAKALGKNGRAFPDAMDGRATKKADSEEDKDPDDVTNTDDAKMRSPVPRPTDEILKMIGETRSRVEELKAERKAINSKISSEIEQLEAKGINRHGFRVGCMILGLDDSQREGFDLSLLLVRKAAKDEPQVDWISE